MRIIIASGAKRPRVSLGFGSPVGHQKPKNSFGLGHCCSTVASGQRLDIQTWVHMSIYIYDNLLVLSIA